MFSYFLKFQFPKEMFLHSCILLLLVYFSVLYLFSQLLFLLCSKENKVDVIIPILQLEGRLPKKFCDFTRVLWHFRARRDFRDHTHTPTHAYPYTHTPTPTHPHPTAPIPAARGIFFLRSQLLRAGTGIHIFGLPVLIFPTSFFLNLTQVHS